MLRDGHEVVVNVDALAVGDRFVVRPGEKVATDGIVEASRRSTARCDRRAVPIEVRAGDEVAGGR